MTTNRLFDVEVEVILEYVRLKEIRDRKNARIKEYRQRPDRQQIDYDRSTIKIQCGCGGRFTEKSKTKHERTNKHIEYDVKEQEKKEQIKNEDLEKWGNIEYDVKEQEKKEQIKNEDLEKWGNIESLI